MKTSQERHLGCDLSLALADQIQRSLQTLGVGGDVIKHLPLGKGCSSVVESPWVHSPILKEEINHSLHYHINSCDVSKWHLCSSFMFRMSVVIRPPTGSCHLIQWLLENRALLDDICQFPWCKYTYHCQFQPLPCLTTDLLISWKCNNQCPGKHSRASSKPTIVQEWIFMGL